MEARVGFQDVTGSSQVTSAARGKTILLKHPQSNLQESMQVSQVTQASEKVCAAHEHDSHASYELVVAHRQEDRELLVTPASDLSDTVYGPCPSKGTRPPF